MGFIAFERNRRGAGCILAVLVALCLAWCPGTARADEPAIDDAGENAIVTDSANLETPEDPLPDDVLAMPDGEESDESETEPIIADQVDEAKVDEPDDDVLPEGESVFEEPAAGEAMRDETSFEVAPSAESLRRAS